LFLNSTKNSLYEKNEEILQKYNNKDLITNNLRLRRYNVDNKLLSTSSSSSSLITLKKTAKNLNDLSNDTKLINSINDSGIEMNIFKRINRKTLSETSLNSFGNNISLLKSSSSTTSLSSSLRTKNRKSGSDSALKSLVLSTSSYNDINDDNYDNIDYGEKYFYNVSRMFFKLNLFLIE
jgi:hypothetical protein